mgnify:FL=1
MFRQQKILIASEVSQLPEEQINRKFQDLGEGWRIVFSNTNASMVNHKFIIYVTTVVAEKETETIPPSIEDLMLNSIFDVNITRHVRILNCLEGEGMYLVKDLLERTPDDLLKIRCRIFPVT